MTYHPPSGLIIAHEPDLSGKCGQVACPGVVGDADRKFFECPVPMAIWVRSVPTMRTPWKRWSHQRQASLHTGTISTGGGLVFVGDRIDLPAFDVDTGNILWETRLGTSVQGHPVSFAIDGKQYIAVTTALGGTSPAQCQVSLLRKSAIRAGEMRSTFFFTG